MPLCRAVNIPNCPLPRDAARSVAAARYEPFRLQCITSRRVPVGDRRARRSAVANQATLATTQATLAITKATVAATRAFVAFYCAGV